MVISLTVNFYFFSKGGISFAISINWEDNRVCVKIDTLITKKLLFHVIVHNFLAPAVTQTLCLIFDCAKNNRRRGAPVTKKCSICFKSSNTQALWLCERCHGFSMILKTKKLWFWNGSISFASPVNQTKTRILRTEK